MRSDKILKLKVPNSDQQFWLSSLYSGQIWMQSDSSLWTLRLVKSWGLRESPQTGQGRVLWDGLAWPYSKWLWHSDCPVERKDHHLIFWPGKERETLKEEGASLKYLPKEPFGQRVPPEPRKDQHDQRGLGGILLEDIEEGLPNSQKAVKVTPLFFLHLNITWIDTVFWL